MHLKIVTTNFTMTQIFIVITPTLVITLLVIHQHTLVLLINLLLINRTLSVFNGLCSLVFPPTQTKIQHISGTVWIPSLII